MYQKKGDPASLFKAIHVLVELSDRGAAWLDSLQSQMDLFNRFIGGLKIGHNQLMLVVFTSVCYLWFLSASFWLYL